MAANRIPQPPFYRAELVKPLLADLEAGECCSIIGTSGTGKSNLTQFLQYQVPAHYLKDKPVWIVTIDSHNLPFQEQKLEYMIFESMVHRLIEEAEDRNFSAEFLSWANDRYDHLLQNPSAYIAFRMLEEVCKRLCRKHEQKLIFVFDQFDDLWKNADAHIFRNLRGLRDQFKYSVVYLTLTRDRLVNMRQDAQETEAFWELFSARTRALGPFSEKDTFAQIERLSIRNDVNRDDISSDQLLKYSGGYPALLRVIFLAFIELPHKSFTVDEVLEVESVCDECRKIWNSLSPIEQGVCQVIARKLSSPVPDAGALNELRFKEIVIGDPAELFSPVFTIYVQQHENTGNNMPGIVVNVPLREVRFDGQLLQPPLPPLEFKLIESLARHAGIVCKREDLLRALYGEEYVDKNDQRLDAILSRLRKALGESARYLVTHRGGGIQLLQGRVIDLEQ